MGWAMGWAGRQTTSCGQLSKHTGHLSSGWAVPGWRQVATAPAIIASACLGTLDHKVLGKKALVVGMVVKILRRQHRRDHRHARVQLHPHQAVDHRVGHKLMAVDAAVHHQRAGHDGRMAPGAGQPLGQQRYLGARRGRQAGSSKAGGWVMPNPQDKVLKSGQTMLAGLARPAQPARSAASEAGRPARAQGRRRRGIVSRQSPGSGGG